MTVYTLRHIDISALAQGRSYKSAGSTARSRVIQKLREEHGPKLVEEYRTAFDAALADRPEGSDEVPQPDKVVLEVELSPLAPVTDLSRKREKTRQGATRLDPVSGAQKIALIVPDDKREVMERLLDEYTYGEMIERGDNQTRAPNEDRIGRIESFRKGTFESFWQDDPAALPGDPQDEIWWGLWCFRDMAAGVVDVARCLGCRVGEPNTHLRFPDTTVIPVFGPKLNIEILLFGTLGIAELRRANDSPTFFVTDVRDDQVPWIEDLAERITWPANDVPTVCLLGTGVNRAHPLLEPAVSAAHLAAVDAAWGADDHAGHDTGMAGLALHGDLTAALGDTGQRALTHRAESVKLLPPQGFDPNAPSAYGPITQAGAAIAETTNPNAPFRVFCLSVTNADRSGAETSAWSAAIDQAAAGRTIGDEEEGGPRRLFMVATGNVQDDMALRTLEEPDMFPAEDPCQAWNALTVGGYTDKTQIADAGYEDWSACAAPGETSPFSRSSYLWREGKSPFKPEIVFEAGNRGLSPAHTEAIAGLPSLSLLTTGADADQIPLEPFWATSAASAQAARMAAQIAAELPGLWPETVRALMVHSARWTPSMLAQLNQARTKESKAELIRRFGYGVPSLERATASARNSLAVVSQREIQPYRLNEDGQVRFNEAHVYPLPWPAQVLEELGATDVRLKITLSYFIEPNPGFSANIDPLRYQSFGLRFDLKRSRETQATFLRRRNLDERRDGERSPNTEPDSGWLLGEKKVSAGSLHCDVWEGNAAELGARNMLWIFPVSGWWRERKSLGRIADRARYALVLTLETDDVEVDLHTPVSSCVEPLIGVEIGV